MDNSHHSFVDPVESLLAFERAINQHPDAKREPPVASLDVNPPNSSLAGVSGAFANMVKHRQRVVRQIAGAPVQALSAFARTNPGAAETDLNTPATTTAGLMRAWLKDRAQDNFLARAIYDSSAWGREDRDREYERRVADRQDAQEKHTLARDAAAQSMEFVVEDMEWLDKQDHDLLRALVNRGYLTAMPQHRSVHHSFFEQGPHARTAPGTAGTAVLPGDRMGSLLDLLPEDPGARLEVALKLSRGEEDMGMTDHAKAIYERWYVLLHEVGHCEYSRLETPFQPSPGRTGEAHAAAVNRWMVGPLGVASPGTYNLLNEAHSDALAAMVLLEATNHDPRAMAVLEEQMEGRRVALEWSDGEMIKQAANNDLTKGDFASVHAATKIALAHVLENVEQWKGKPADQIRQLAQQYASDGFMDYLNPSRTLEDGTPIGTILADNAVPDAPLLNTLVGRCEYLTATYVRNADPVSWLNGHADHPAAAMLLQTWANALPDLQKALASPFMEGSEVPLVEGVYRGDFAARGAVSQVISRSASPAMDPDGPAYQAVRQAFDQELPLLREALRSCRRPKSVAQWRQSRLEGDTSVGAKQLERPKPL